MVVIALILLLPLLEASQVCKNPIDLSNGISVNGSIEFEGIKYKIGEDYIGGRLNNESQCDCSAKPCIRKCCPPDYGSNKKKECVPYQKDLQVPFMTNVSLDKSMFHYVYGMIETSQKNGKYARIKASQTGDNYFVDKDGTLQVYISASGETLSFDHDKYCLETFVDPEGKKPDKVDALICLPLSPPDTPKNLMVISISMIVSCVFILATLGVYAWLPELRNLHGRVLMCYLSCLLLGFVVLAGLQIQQHVSTITQNVCFPMGIAIYLCLVAAFFWLNVMCFDIYWTFSGKRGLSLEKLSIQGRFYAYCAYAFGVPVLMTALMLALEYSGLKSQFLPNLESAGCFLYGVPKLIYFYGPMAFLCVMNIVFFALTALKIARVSKQTSVLQSGESATHDQQRNDSDKQRFLLYVKLFVVMGVNWILEVISGVIEPSDNYRSIIFLITDLYNVLIGVTIFVLFVCKRKIFRLIKKRYKQLSGQPMSRQGTSMTTTSRLSGKEEMQMSTKPAH